MRHYQDETKNLVGDYERTLNFKNDHRKIITSIM